MVELRSTKRPKSEKAVPAAIFELLFFTAPSFISISKHFFPLSRKKYIVSELTGTGFTNHQGRVAQAFLFETRAGICSVVERSLKIVKNA
jgi:hypothetical protein